MKNITISVDDELWTRIREAAASECKSMNSFIRETLGRTVGRSQQSVGDRIVALAEEFGHSGSPWKWNREEIYEDAL